MIAFLEGTIRAIEADYLVLQTSAGVGYQLFLPQILLSQALKNENCQYHVHTYVREGEITLYGFASHEERKLFEMLIKTTGVGPKLAIVILSSLRPPQLIQAVYGQNIAQFNAIPGIGIKTASKLCLDMSDQLQKHPIGGIEWSPSRTETPAAESSPRNALLSALKNMGFSEKDVLSVLGKVEAEEESFEAQFKKALGLLTSFQ